MRYSNLHNHTVFSDGRHTPEENVLAAIEAGMESLGFSDHSDTPCDQSYCMKTPQYDAYIACIDELKDRYAQKLRIFTGMELDAYSEIPTQKLDYRIASVHYILENGKCYPIDHSLPQQQACAAEVFGGDRVAMARHYFQILTEHVRRCRPNLVGHFDVITKFGFMPEEDPAYRAAARQALEQIIPVCPYIEVNTGAIARGCRDIPYPAPYLWDTLKACGARPVLGSDSHDKKNLCFYFDQSVALLKQAGFDRIWVFTGTDYESRDI